MSQILAALACNLDKDILQATLPLLIAEEVEAMEWSFDALFKTRNIPSWFVELLKEVSQAGRLIGHGVFFSMFTGKWSEEQSRWLKHLEKVSNAFQFEHISEHFGFMTGENFHQGAPISLPFTTSTLAIGQDRLKRIQQACNCPVGLENLAIAYSLEEVEKHGTFLAALLEPVNGFIILDLHNFYCQLHNFELNYDELIQKYPLHLVREIHISGGSWEDSDLFHGKPIRRDTHDDSVPEVVFQLLETTIARCPNVKYVVLEQLGIGLKTEASKLQFQKDFRRMATIVQKNNPIKEDQNTFLPNRKYELGEAVQDLQLYQEQMELSEILETAKDWKEAQRQIQASSLVGSAWKTEQWAPHMLDTVLKIAQKWKNGF